jgi:hypothetical protein
MPGGQILAVTGDVTGTIYQDAPHSDDTDDVVATLQSRDALSDLTASDVVHSMTTPMCRDDVSSASSPTSRSRLFTGDVKSMAAARAAATRILERMEVSTPGGAVFEVGTGTW